MLGGGGWVGGVALWLLVNCLLIGCVWCVMLHLAAKRLLGDKVLRQGLMGRQHR